jgi:hypothetical protein
MKYRMAPMWLANFLENDNVSVRRESTVMEWMENPAGFIRKPVSRWG